MDQRSGQGIARASLNSQSWLDAAVVKMRGVLDAIRRLHTDFEWIENAAFIVRDARDALRFQRFNRH